MTRPAEEETSGTTVTSQRGVTMLTKKGQSSSCKSVTAMTQQKTGRCWTGQEVPVGKVSVHRASFVNEGEMRAQTAQEGTSAPTAVEGSRIE